MDSYGLHVINDGGETRLDGEDETMRLTYSRYIDPQQAAYGYHVFLNLTIPGFNRAKDRVVFVPGAGTLLRYDGNQHSQYGGAPYVVVTNTGVTLRYQGSAYSFDGTTYFTDGYLVCLRSGA